MLGSFLTRGLVMVLGYAYPAYECFKTVEMNKPEIEHLRFWCQYWILVAVLTVSEKVGDAFISWLPMYSEAKLAFFIYLWYPKTRGTTYVYDSFLRPCVAKHETDIDRNLVELRTSAVLYCQKAASCGQTRIFEILQYFASQSPLRHQPAQQRQVPVAGPTPPPEPQSTRPPATVQQQQPALHQPPNPAIYMTAQQHEPAKDAPPPAPPPKHPVSNQEPKTAPNQPVKAEASLAVTDGNAEPPLQEVVMEDAIRVTRGRLRKSRAAPNC